MDNKSDKSDRYEDRGNFFPDIAAINRISAEVTKKSYSETVEKTEKEQ